MEMTQEELNELKKIKRKIYQYLRKNSMYQKLIERKEKILNYLKLVKDSDEKKKLISKYEKIGKKIQEIELSMAYKIAIENKKKNDEKNNYLIKIFNKLLKKCLKNDTDSYNKEFNKIVEDSAYAKQIKIRNEIFQKLIKTNKKERELLYELESLEIEIATMETDKVKEYIMKK